MEEFGAFFRRATREEKTPQGQDPYPYQRGLAAEPMQSRALCIPTGAGKTAAVVLSWLYRRQVDPANTPRRLILVQPMRTLVEQAVEGVRAWVSRLELGARVHRMIGGEADYKWDICPEDEAIIIGTQDILLSGALNRGYAMKRYRWPISFGLLNNDCVWVLDEVQLMGAGLTTSTQLAALREKVGIFGRCASIWMSATFTPECLRSVDFAAVSASLPVVTLTPEDIEDERLSIRLNAPKQLAQAPGSCFLPQGLAEFIKQKHRAESQTLVVVNRVARARETYDLLKRLYDVAEVQPEIRLLHSRFRGWERRAWPELLRSGIPAAGRIIVATQIIEAGVDISSSVLISDLAPYSSMVQRFGRCNRDGKVEGAEIFWIGRPLVTKEAKLSDVDGLTAEQRTEIARPYEADELAQARSLLTGLTSASSRDLPAVPYTPSATHVLRKRDLVDLFDTTRDLSGYDVDVSRFVRSGQDRDVLVAWRDVGEGGPPRKTPRPTQDELCPAPIGEFKAFLEGAKGKPRRVAWRWEQLDGKWQSVDFAGVNRLYPGMILILDRLGGGYDPVRGWDPSDWSEVGVVGAKTVEEFEADSDDPLAFRDYDQELTAHLREVRERAEAILDRLAGLGVEPFREALFNAAAAHDIGKAHPVFQKTLHAGDDRPVMLAKSKAKGRHERKYFRHELASALALLSSGASDLIAYLAASHHGKVRLSIRAVPGEAKPAQVDAKFARGIHEGDRLPAVDTRLGIATPDLVLDLEPMLLGENGGGPSWLARMTRLRDEIGVFRLAYLEALIRAADERASAEPKEVL